MRLFGWAQWLPLTVSVSGVFYSLLPWFAGEIKSSQVVEFRIGGKWGKEMSEGPIIWSIKIPVSEEALNYEFWNQVVLLPCKVVLDKQP